jgi:hypothetical protein
MDFALARASANIRLRQLLPALPAMPAFAAEDVLRQAPKRDLRSTVRALAEHPVLRTLSTIGHRFVLRNADESYETVITAPLVIEKKLSERHFKAQWDLVGTETENFVESRHTDPEVLVHRGPPLCGAPTSDGACGLRRP